MLFVCIPVHNEAATIGVLLWRIRTVLQGQSRDYEVVVYDDGSTDGTAEVLEPYAKVLPLTVLRGSRRRGTAAAVDALCRHVVGTTRYPRRDALVLMQGDFTDRPDDLPELVRRFEGGADLVVGARPLTAATPLPERRLRRLAAWGLRPLVRIDGVTDPLPALRLFRVSVVRDLLRVRDGAPLTEADGWSAAVELLVRAVPFARRVETLPVEADHALRTRASRLQWKAELAALARWGWRARGTRVAPGERLADRTERAPRSERVGEDGGHGGAVETAGESNGAPLERPRVVERSARLAPDDAVDRPERPRRAERPARPARGARPRPSAPEQAPPPPEPGAEDRPTTRSSRRRRRGGEPATAGASADAAGTGDRPPDAEAPLASPASLEAHATDPAPNDDASSGPRRRRRGRRRGRGATAGEGAATDVADGAGEASSGGHPSVGAPSGRVASLAPDSVLGGDASASGPSPTDEREGDARGTSAEGTQATGRPARRRRGRSRRVVEPGAAPGSASPEGVPPAVPASDST